MSTKGIKILAADFAEDIINENAGVYIDDTLEMLIENITDPEIRGGLEKIYEKGDMYCTLQDEVTRYIEENYLNNGVVKRYFNEFGFDFNKYNNKMEKLARDYNFYVKLDEAFDNLVPAWFDNETSLLNDVIYYTLEMFNYNKDRILEFLQNPNLEGGSISELTYYSDTTVFYEKHKEEINHILSEKLDECDMDITELRLWNKRDPLALEDDNKNTLAWFGFEEKARQLADEMYDVLKNL